MTARRIGLVAVHVFKESVRDRVLYSILAFAIVLVGASILIGEITAGQDLKILKDLGLATIEIAGLVMTVFIGVGLVAREIDRRSVHSLLAKPLPRWEFIVGKYAGLLATIVINVALMTFVLYLVLAWMGWRAPEEIRRSWEAPAVDPAILFAVMLILAELALLTAIAVFFSTFSSSGLVSVVLTAGVWVAGLASPDLRAFGQSSESSLGVIVSSIGWMLPAFSVFDVKSAVVHGQVLPLTLIGLRVLYAAVYSSVIVGAAVLVFSRREFR
jgi:Cu-processing system permease protein